jgi:hypothetical protein
MEGNMGKMTLRNGGIYPWVTLSLILMLTLLGCSSAKNSGESTQKLGSLSLTPETAAFVQAYANQSKNAAGEDIPLQVSFRVAPAADEATVCDTGVLQGPYTIKGGALVDGKTVTPSQPVLRNINTNDIAICLIITSPVDAILNASADKVVVNTDTCDQPAADISGTWSGNYSCTDSCYTDGFAGIVELSIEQDGYGATYTDDEGGSYEGTVCGNVFKFSGGGPGYTESGTFTLNADGSGSKTSSWANTENSCHGDCSDPNLQKS